MVNNFHLPFFSPRAAALGEGILTERASPSWSSSRVFSGENEMAEEAHSIGEVKKLDDAGIRVPRQIRVCDQARKTLRDCRRYLLSVRDESERNELAESLRRGLSRIAAVAECGGEQAELFSDGAPLSFTWRAGGLFGGLLFHGPHDGYGSGGAPTFAVSLCRTYGWQIHT